ncbi:secretion pathway protein Sls2/Rcy1 [Xylona heveae TC161]|uniref:Secretion pathway protein Sls2/Rcy1 n=1 Tax=Xylona heveae (strain CBS 132557 / TC161) TaxID=1328760 RepID=A0A165K0A7_XYLHT|nr:secretion pathway protein Sls2/Rcy1 [Xylona heveae TC161]KZF26845.1 secretion pathway protein Sls2/Rcy1 [Xylona heveae TC161]
MSTFKRATVVGGPPLMEKRDVLQPLRVTQIISSKAILPAEIISMIIDFLPPSDLIRFAQTSKRMQEMVYDDARWVQKLRLMGCWSDLEARKRVEGSMRKRYEAHRSKAEIPGASGGADGLEGINGGLDSLNLSHVSRPSITLFDATAEEEHRQSLEAMARQSIEVLPGDGGQKATHRRRPTLSDLESCLGVFDRVRSIRGFARQEFGRIYGAIAPFYLDLARSKSHSDPIVFQAFRDPEQQAQMLAQLRRFSKSDTAEGWQHRVGKLEAMIEMFEGAVLREFEQGYEIGDVDGRMKRYAHVLVTLNGGQAAVELFIQKHALLAGRDKLGNPLDCLEHAAPGTIDLGPAHEFFTRLTIAVNEQSDVIDRVFPSSVNVLLSLLERVGEDVISEYVTPLFDEAHSTNLESYLKAVPGLYGQSINFGKSVNPTKGSGDHFRQDVHTILAAVFEPHLDLYLQDELDFFRTRSDAKVSEWERQLVEEEASTESFFMSNVSRHVDKRDFLTSFKKVVMMPVNALPTIPISSPFASNKAAQSEAEEKASEPTKAGSDTSSRPSTPSVASNVNPVRLSQIAAPTTELAAKAAIMNSRLEGIRSLFSIEVALSLIHAAKSGLERVAMFVSLGGQTGEEAKEQCEAIFVLLLQILSSKHMRPGFDKALDHLTKYNPRDVNEHSQPGVAPLVMFLELVNVGDLIQQMVDVFYEQELVAMKLTDRNDFLDPAVQEKKRFEQMLDERVAAGLNRGVDVLIDEVEYVCATTQIVTDFNPGATSDTANQIVDIGPTETARKVVEIVSSHTRMLVGSTDKHMLEVFNQEVGLRLFTALCKHLKRQRISLDGAIKLISDMNHYFSYIYTMKNPALLEYFKALRELAQIYLIDPAHAKEMATIIADVDRFHGIFRPEEVYEFAERRADWFVVRRSVERAMYGIGCSVM